MILHDSIRSWDAGPTCFAVGMFDGIHRGHRKVMEALAGEAERLGAAPAVFTFRNHPRPVLSPQEPPLLLLTGAEHKARLLEHYGAALTVMVRFDETLAATEAGEFLRLLKEEYACKGLVLGEDARLGRGGVGGDELRETAETLGMGVAFVPAVQVEGQVVSSSEVRKAVYSADLKRAALLLGRHFSTFGRVVQGDGIGRSLGFPTVNIDCHREARPPFGVYAGWVLMEGKPPLPAAANVGVRPSIDDRGERDFLIEAHVIDEELPELYGTEVELLYVEKVRDERFFSSREALSKQIAEDVEAGRQVLEQSGPCREGAYAVQFG